MQPTSLAMVPADAALSAAIQRELKQLIGARRYDHWFHEKTTLRIADECLHVGVGSPFLLNWMQRQFRAPLQETAQAILGPAARVQFEVDAAANPAPAPARPAEQAVTASTIVAAAIPANATPSPEGARPRTPPAAGRRGLELADFVEGPSNELALTAVRQVCQAPGAKLNPLYLYGGVGTGKTHLLEAICRQIRRLHPALKVVSLTSEAFTNYFTQALTDHALPGFRQKFRNVDVLLVDDIDFLNSKRVIQEEFLHTFMELERQGRQIVLTSDRHPRMLNRHSDELTTRFLSGLVCRIEAPDEETRRTIVARKAAAMQADFSKDVLHYVAHRFRNNVRELEGSLNCLQTYHLMTGARVGLAEARQVLAELERDCVRIVRMSDIEQAVCTLFGIKAKELKSPRRTRAVSQPRMLAMFLTRKYTQAAYSEIGQYYGGRNHSTVMSAERKVEEWLKKGTRIQVASQDWSPRELIEALEQQLEAG